VRACARVRHEGLELEQAPVEAHASVRRFGEAGHTDVDAAVHLRHAVVLEVVGGETRTLQRPLREVLKHVRKLIRVRGGHVLAVDRYKCARIVLLVPVGLDTGRKSNILELDNDAHERHQTIECQSRVPNSPQLHMLAVAGVRRICIVVAKETPNCLLLDFDDVNLHLVAGTTRIHLSATHFIFERKNPHVHYHVERDDEDRQNLDRHRHRGGVAVGGGGVEGMQAIDHAEPELPVVRCAEE